MATSQSSSGVNILFILSPKQLVMHLAEGEKVTWPRPLGETIQETDSKWKQAVAEPIKPCAVGKVSNQEPRMLWLAFQEHRMLWLAFQGALVLWLAFPEPRMPWLAFGISVLR